MNFHALSCLEPMHVFIECPRVYPTGTPNPNDLIKLAVMVGEYKAKFEALGPRWPVTLVAPSDWKAQLPKAITEARMRARFPDVDQWLTDIPKSKQHNLFDALGIACYGWNRANKA